MILNILHVAGAKLPPKKVTRAESQMLKKSSIYLPTLPFDDEESWGVLVTPIVQVVLSRTPNHLKCFFTCSLLTTVTRSDLPAHLQISERCHFLGGKYSIEHFIRPGTWRISGTVVPQYFIRRLQSLMTCVTFGNLTKRQISIIFQKHWPALSIKDISQKWECQRIYVFGPQVSSHGTTWPML